MDIEEIKKIANRSLMEYLENEKEKFQENVDEQQSYEEAEKARIALFGSDYAFLEFNGNESDCNGKEDHTSADSAGQDLRDFAGSSGSDHKSESHTFRNHAGQDLEKYKGNLNGKCSAVLCGK